MKKGNNLKPFKKGQSGNPKGRPKKTFTKFMEEIKEEGYELVSRAMFTEAIDALLGLDEKKLADIIKDNTARGRKSLVFGRKVAFAVNFRNLKKK